MAHTTILVLALALAISMQGTLGSMVGFGHHTNIRCEDLDRDTCAFSVSSTGNRCVLESRLVLRSGVVEYTCRTSDIVADKHANHIETDECIQACGVDRGSLGISSDSLLDHTFAGKLCSDTCFKNCPNIVDLYFNLAAGEGVYLMSFCEARREGERRGMMENYGTSHLENAVSPAANELNVVNEVPSFADPPGPDA